jgi:hypothetical protein
MLMTIQYISEGYNEKSIQINNQSITKFISNILEFKWNFSLVYCIALPYYAL